MIAVAAYIALLAHAAVAPVPPVVHAQPVGPAGAPAQPVRNSTSCWHYHSHLVHSHCHTFPRVTLLLNYHSGSR